MKQLHPLHLVFAAAIFIALGVLLSLRPSQTLLYGNQPELDANSMIAILQSRGIDAQKEQDTDTTFKIMVNENFFEPSVDVLRWYGYPRRENSGAEAFYEQSGIVSSPEQTRARYARAVSLDIAKTLEEINGISSARVHAVLPRKDNFGEQQQAASAGVLLIYDPRIEIQGVEKAARELLLQSIEGIEAKNIAVVSLPTRVWEFLDAEQFQSRDTFWGIQVDPASASRFNLLINSFIALIALLVLMLGAVVFVHTKDSRKPDAAVDADTQDPNPPPHENTPHSTS